MAVGGANGPPMLKSVWSDMKMKANYDKEKKEKEGVRGRILDEVESNPYVCCSSQVYTYDVVMMLSAKRDGGVRIGRWWCQRPSDA